MSDTAADCSLPPPPPPPADTGSAPICSSTDRNVFLYWTGVEPSLILILRNLIYLHSTHGEGYRVHLITPANVADYIGGVPDGFHQLIPPHQADVVRVLVVCEYGGIWLDSDTIVMDKLDALFDFITGDHDRSGFLFKENNEILWNGIFGSRARTPLFLHWRTRVLQRLASGVDLGWTDLGNSMLNDMWQSDHTIFDSYTIMNGLDTVYPVNWDQCVDKFVNQPYDSYKSLIRPFQPVVVLVNSVYKRLGHLSPTALIAYSATNSVPLHYFLNTSFASAHLVDHDFVEIGTSNFDTLLQTAAAATGAQPIVGISVDAIKHYLDALPDVRGVTKVHAGISDSDGTCEVYYVPEETVDELCLPNWLKGCNSIHKCHPLHVQHGWTHLVRTISVRILSAARLFFGHRVRAVAFLKIDTEGHDCVILRSLHAYLQALPGVFHPRKIQFESNEHSDPIDVTRTIDAFVGIGYTLVSRGYDTVLQTSRQ